MQMIDDDKDDRNVIRLMRDPRWRDLHPCNGCRYQRVLPPARMCAALDVSAETALSPGGACGPDQMLFAEEP
jgi:hypothetical protein